MYYVNKIVGFLASPLSLGILAAFVAFVLICLCDCAKGKKARKYAIFLSGFSLVWLWMMSTNAICRWTGIALESPWLGADGKVPCVETYNHADLIVLLSGGMGANTNVSPYAEMYMGADRAWQAARLYNAGKASRIVLTGLDSRESTMPLLMNLGVPSEAMLVDNDSMNTEENAKFTRDLLDRHGLLMGGYKPKVLLVTSAFHMKRSLLIFQKYASELEVIPAPSDFEVLSIARDPIRIYDFLPDAGALGRTNMHIKEFIGYLGYKLLR